MIIHISAYASFMLTHAITNNASNVMNNEVQPLVSPATLVEGDRLVIIHRPISVPVHKYRRRKSS